MNISFLKYRKIYFIFSGILVLASLACLAVFGLRFGIEFEGGSLVEVKFVEERPTTEEIRTKLKGLYLGEIIVQPTEEKGVIIRMKPTDIETRELAVQQLKEKGELVVMRNDLIGPVIGQELRDSAKIMAVLAILAIVLYIAIAFRRVSRPVSSWQYGIASLIALFHDILIVIGLFSFLGFFYYIELTIPIVTALLVVLGYSINDSVVILDRIRENLIKKIGITYEETVNISLNQTLGRSIATSLTTLFVLLAIFFFGGITLKYFALALIVGIILGTYSSIFLVGPLLVSWEKHNLLKLKKDNNV